MADHDDTLSSVITLLNTFIEESGKTTITADTDLVADLGLDSVQVMDLLLQIEDLFDISVPLNILPEVKTVNDLATQIHKLLESN